jgi:hypothetical protein
MVFSPIKLVRRSVDGVKDYCKWQKSASPQPRLLVDVAGFIYGPDGRGLQSINLTSRAALCARRAGVRVISVSVSAHAFPTGGQPSPSLAACCHFSLGSSRVIQTRRQSCCPCLTDEAPCLT